MREPAWGHARIAAIVAIAVSLALPAGCHDEADRTAPKNLVLVVSDALRAANLPLYGYPRNTAPRLVELAEESIVFDHHLVHFPGTSISTSQLMTGRLMSPLLMSYKYIAVPVRALPADLLVLPDALRRAGYRTSLITSHYWLREDSRLLEHFDEHVFVAPHGDQSYAFFEDLWPAITDRLERAAAEEAPFFLYLHTMDTHGPNQPHPGFGGFPDARSFPDEYNRYDAEIRYTDHWTGRLVDELGKRGLLENTWFVFTADHGDEFNEVGPGRWNRDHGIQVRRPLVHVPLLIRPPGGMRPPLRWRGLTRHVDLAPTLVSLLAPGREHHYRVDGVDLGPDLLDGSDGRGRRQRSFAYSPRFWGVYDDDHEVHYDQWNDSFSPLLRVVHDARNYPRLEPVESPGRRRELVSALSAERRRLTEEFLTLAPNEHLDSAELAIFMNVDPAGAVPVFADRPGDDRWALAGPVLRCGPEEEPGAVTLFTPWVPGSYRVRLLLYGPARRAGYRNHFTFETPGENPSVRIDGERADEQGRVDAGVHRVGRELRFRIAEPEGGVAIAGLLLDRISTDTEGSPADEALRERLRALGYLPEE